MHSTVKTAENRMHMRMLYELNVKLFSLSPTVVEWEDVLFYLTLTMIYYFSICGCYF